MQNLSSKTLDALDLAGANWRTTSFSLILTVQQEPHFTHTSPAGTTVKIAHTSCHLNIEERQTLEEIRKLAQDSLAIGALERLRSAAFADRAYCSSIAMRLLRLTYCFPKTTSVFSRSLGQTKSVVRVTTQPTSQQLIRAPRFSNQTTIGVKFR